MAKIKKIFLFLIIIVILWYILMFKNNFLIHNNLKNKLDQKKIQIQKKSEINVSDQQYTIKENSQTFKDKNLLDFIEKIYLQLQNKIHTIDDELKKFQKNNYNLNEQFVHNYKKLEEINQKISRITNSLNQKQQTLIQNKISTFKVDSLTPLQQQIHHLRKKQSQLAEEIKNIKIQIKTIQKDKIDLEQAKSIYHSILYELSQYNNNITITIENQ
ncbi:effector ['Planchonia careya' phytoplasma]|nr:effector ['Planchonia careya' phytoplasma]MDO8030097.1 effector ['Planchonia careya' phytoplasma]